MNARRYQSVFAHVPYQFCGHVTEYLVANTEHLCLFVFETRFGKKRHSIERYENGVKTGERELRSSHNVFLYYWRWFLYAHVELFRFAAKAPGRTIVFCGHPVNLFGMTLHRLVHRVRYAYWIGDYFPSRSIVIRCFELPPAAGEKTNVIRALDAAEIVAHELDSDVFLFQDIDQAVSTDRDGNSVVTATATFSTQLKLTKGE